MKTFSNPEIEIIRFATEDIMTTSDNMLPVLPFSDYVENQLTIVSLD